MTVVDRIDKPALRDLLVRCWLSHDAMWFAAALRDHGIDTANRLNLAAIRGLAPIEVRRMLRTLGMEGVSGAGELRAFLDGAMDLVGGDFMEFAWDWRPDGRLRVEAAKCFAHEGISRLGAIEHYECGIFERIGAWFEALGIAHEIAPADRRCLLHHEGRCRHEVRFARNDRQAGGVDAG